MTWRSTAGLGAVLALLLGALWWSAPPAIDPTPEAEPLLGRAAAVTAIELHAPGPPRRFERAPDGRWRTPDGAAAPEGVATLVDALRTLVPLMVIADQPADAREFGFDADAARLVVWAGDRRALDLEIGDRNPAWTGVYVRRRGKRRIELVGALLLWELAKVTAPNGRPAGATGTPNALTRRRKTGEPSGSRPAKEAP